MDLYLDFFLSQANEMLLFFRYDHLPERLQVVSKPFADIAYSLRNVIPMSAEHLACLRKLLEAKDCAVRAALQKP